MDFSRKKSICYLFLMLCPQLPAAPLEDPLGRESPGALGGTGGSCRELVLKHGEF
jgi:hypothetical protein